ncbi:MAG: hypothetical protein ACOYM3_26545 [Terrimicrobiaceae bacterium]
MPSTHKQDLEKLDALAYHRREYSQDDIRRFHSLRRRRGRKPLALLDVLHHWMMVPITLWPLNIHDVFHACLDSVEAGRQLDEEMLFLLGALPEPPGDEVCRIVAAHEHLVQHGSYESLIKTQAKFDSIEKNAMRNPDLIREWESIKKQWDISQFANTKGILRRSLTGERNLRPQFKVDWSKPRHRFQAAFDAFYSRWNLYGMQGDKPLTMKLSVNLTPHGTMIFIPAYWSFDAKRDVRWAAVKKLHGARALKKQGAGLAEGIEQRRADAEKLRMLDAEAKRLKLKGDACHAFLCNGLGLVEATDPKRLARLRKEFGKSS